MKKVFVSGASGFQGRPTAQLLVAKGYEVVTLKKGTPHGLDLEDNIASVAGGFEDENAINQALKGVEVAVFTLPMVFGLELAQSMANNFVQAAKMNQVELVVFNSSFDLPKANTGFLALDLKVAVKKVLDNSGLNVTTLMPDVYIDNLAAPWSIPLIVEQGILPYPVANGQAIPWISHIDLAKFVVSAIEKPELAGQILPIGGNVVSGDVIAAEISNKLGKAVQFIGITPDDFEKNLIPAFGELAAREVSNLYRYMEQNKDSISSKDFTSTQRLLNVKLQSIDEWVDSVQWM